MNVADEHADDVRVPPDDVTTLRTVVKAHAVEERHADRKRRVVQACQRRYTGP